ncbi:hypothetical protein BDP27DRAFT_44123 [Rhodocollybia butyracea]|uniref:Uncharacterized protein n=1 Tax=Rhodocollybia butyracea TaxID=206335 RepID=A0A9P5UDM9_9AGAR|nr:hypothetical protein BDP27DRAFT_44123 [Rhodocollybia butyracea]
MPLPRCRDSNDQSPIFLSSSRRTRPMIINGGLVYLNHNFRMDFRRTGCCYYPFQSGYNRWCTDNGGTVCICLLVGPRHRKTQLGRRTVKMGIDRRDEQLVKY